MSDADVPQMPSATNPMTLPMKFPRALAILVSALATVAVLAAGCAQRRVTRVEPATPVDLSGRWNDTDSRLVAEARERLGV